MPHSFSVCAPGFLTFYILSVFRFGLFGLYSPAEAAAFSACTSSFVHAPAKAISLMAFVGVRLSLRMLCIIGFITYQVNRLLGIFVFCTFDFLIYPVGLCNIIKAERAAVLQAARPAV